MGTFFQRPISCSRTISGNTRGGKNDCTGEFCQQQIPTEIHPYKLRILLAQIRRWQKIAHQLQHVQGFQ
jgi:hypothetical protein